MNVEYSRDFEKTVRKLSGKVLSSVKEAILEVRNAHSVSQLTNCKKLVGYNHAYRLRIGDLRAFFVLHIEGDTVSFEYLVPRGEAYSKKMKEQLKRKDN
jgi:mRNA-degrading endonuclease RelE of RelBE toxin-antitoxin system